MFIIGFYLMKKFAKKGPVPPEDKQSDTELDLIDLDEQGAKA
jgi:cytochrome d ubiquinol oxidase subunit I